MPSVSRDATLTRLLHCCYLATLNAAWSTVPRHPKRVVPVVVPARVVLPNLLDRSHRGNLDGVISSTILMDGSSSRSLGTGAHLISGIKQLCKRSFAWICKIPAKVSRRVAQALHASTEWTDEARTWLSRTPVRFSKRTSPTLHSSAEWTDEARTWLSSTPAKFSERATPVFDAMAHKYTSSGDWATRRLERMRSRHTPTRKQALLKKDLEEEAEAAVHGAETAEKEHEERVEAAGHMQQVVQENGHQESSESAAGFDEAEAAEASVLWARTALARAKAAVERADEIERVANILVESSAEEAAAIRSYPGSAALVADVDPNFSVNAHAVAAKADGEEATKSEAERRAELNLVVDRTTAGSVAEGAGDPLVDPVRGETTATTAARATSLKTAADARGADVNSESPVSVAASADLASRSPWRRHRIQEIESLEPPAGEVAWRHEDDLKIMSLHKEHGPKWGRIASLLGGERSIASVRNIFDRVQSAEKLREEEDAHLTKRVPG